MSELFIELFSEEVPAKLQIKAREQLKEILSRLSIITNNIQNRNFIFAMERLPYHIAPLTQSLFHLK